MYWQVLLLPLLAASPTGPAQQDEPMVIYGYAYDDAADSSFIRLELGGSTGARAMRLAMFGRSPIPFDSVSMAADTSIMSWIWPGRLYGRCSVRRVAEYHWTGSCRSDQDQRAIVLGGDYNPDLGQDLVAGEADLAILDRAIDLLESAATWNRADERVCEDDQQSGRLSLFCALFVASHEVTGEYLHRRPAMNAPREVIAELAPDRIYAHTLRDFNNHPATSHEEMMAVLQEARRRLSVGG